MQPTYRWQSVSLTVEAPPSGAKLQKEHVSVTVSKV
jgi:hypothetical protein